MASEELHDHRYNNEEEFISDSKKLSRRFNQRQKGEYVDNDAKLIMRATLHWHYRYNASPSKDECLVGSKTLVQKLCSLIIRGMLKIPSRCHLHFCLFCKGKDCCPEFRWIYASTTTVSSSSDSSLYLAKQIRLCAPLRHILTLSAQSRQAHQLIVVLRLHDQSSANNPDICMRFKYKTISRSVLTSSFSRAKKDYMYRVSYAPKQTVLAIKLHESVVMTLSGGIVGAGFCNLVSDEESKTEDPCHALLHILDEDIDDVKLKFFFKEGCVADIDVFMETDGTLIKFVQYSHDAGHASTDHGEVNDHAQQISPPPPFQQSFSSETDSETLQNTGIQYEQQMGQANQVNQQYAIGMACNGRYEQAYNVVPAHHISDAVQAAIQYVPSVPHQYQPQAQPAVMPMNEHRTAQQSQAANANDYGEFNPVIPVDYQMTQDSNIQEQPNESMRFPDESRSTVFAATPQPFPDTDPFQQYLPRSPPPSFPVNPSLCFNYNYGPHRGHGSPTVIGYRYDPMASSEHTLPSSHRTPY